MCPSCERLLGTGNDNNVIDDSGNVANVVVKSEIASLDSEMVPEIVLKLEEESENNSLKEEDGTFVVHGEARDEEDEGFSFDEDSEITYSEDDDEEDNDVKPEVSECHIINVLSVFMAFYLFQNVDYLEFIDPPTKKSRRSGKKRKKRRGGPKKEPTYDFKVGKLLIRFLANRFFIGLLFVLDSAPFAARPATARTASTSWFLTPPPSMRARPSRCPASGARSSWTSGSSGATGGSARPVAGFPATCAAGRSPRAYHCRPTSLGNISSTGREEFLIEVRFTLSKLPFPH